MRPSPLGAPTRILVVDDDPASRLLLVDLLLPEGFDVVTAESAEAALAEISRRVPDLILSDVSMGKGMTGVDLCRTLRSREETRFVPFIAVTGCHATEARVAGLAAGADDYLEKPVVPAELLARVRATVRLGAYQRILADREKLLTVTSAMSDGLVSMTPDWRLATANAAARRLLIPTCEAGGDVLSAAAAGFDASIPFARLLSDVEREVRFDLSRRPGTGPRLVLGAALTRLSGADGRATELVLSLRDVTSERFAERTKDDFVALASHKLRTPLTILEGHLQMWADGSLGDVGPDQREAVGAMSRGVAELKGIVEGLIHFADSSRSERRLAPAPVAFEEIVDLVRTETKERCARRGGLPFEIEADPTATTEWAASVDSWALGEIVGEIADNAVKFCDKETLRVRVKRLPAPAGLVRFSVGDNGKGFPHELSEAVFETFHQYEACVTGNVAGFGLGLTLVQRLVARTGGSVSVRSDSGRGTDVILELPAANPARSDALV